MRLPEPRVAVPWLIGVSLRVSLVSLVLVISFGVAARTDSIDRAQRRMTAQAEGLTRQIENDMAQFDLVLRDAARLSPSRDDARLSPSRDDARLSPSRDAGTSAPRMSFLDLPLTSHYVEFINVLNEVGDVVADPRSNVSRPVNFAGRDYFQGHLKNPADIVMIGRPFATAPTQHASIPISRRLNRPDGTFAGVVVAGVRLDWLNDLLSHATMIPQAIVTVRRDDGLILIRAPYDLDAIGRSGTTDAAWQRYLRTGRSETTDDPAGIQVFRRLGPLVLELTLDRADLAAEERSWSIWLPTLTLLPALCVLVLGFAARDLLRRGSRIEAASDSASDECMRLLANMSHELRTPLTGIIGQAELLTDEGGLTDRQSERLAIVTEAGRLMRGIVDRVIDIARPDELTAAPLLTPCDLDPLVRACLGVVEGEARRKGILLISTIDPAAPRRAMLDQDRVRQMLINLLMNAVKYTVRGSVALRISGDASHLRFEVADTGPGIPVRKRWRLFRAYDRLDAAASHPKGTGLGLSITQRFTHRMGGQIGYAENPGGGSIFWIELPITEPLAPIAVATENPTPEPSSETRHLSILLPRTAGHQVIEVPDGEFAVAAVREHDFDVVLTDMRMPVVDGMEVTRRIALWRVTGGCTPVVLVTADLLALADGASGRAGIDGCVRKPFTRAELLAAVLSAARLAPVPDDDASALHAATLADLKQTLGNATVAAHLDAAAHRITDLLTLLESPEGTESATLRDAVHDLTGVCGLLGFTALSTNLRWFDTATDRTAPAAALHDAATAALRALHRPRGPEAVDG